MRSPVRRKYAAKAAHDARGGQGKKASLSDFKKTTGKGMVKE